MVGNTTLKWGEQGGALSFTYSLACAQALSRSAGMGLGQQWASTRTWGLPALGSSVCREVNVPFRNHTLTVI